MDKRAILIVEDEAIVAADLAGKLVQLGYEVAGSVARGEEAIDLADHVRPDLVLMDIKLEGPLDGIETAEAIRRKHDVPIIYLTAHSDAATLARARLSEPFGYILKPFEERELATNIEMALYKHELDRQTREQRDQLLARAEELQAANEALRSSRTGALNLMEDALEARSRAEQVSEELRREIAERMRVEDALREGEQLLRDVIDGSPAPIFLKDRDGKFITINSSLERMLGMSRQELKGKTDYDIAPKEVADYWRSHDREVMATGKAIQIEEVADLQDGHHIFLANKFPLVNARGQVYGVGAISHDITDRKKADEALRESERRYRSLFENMMHGFAYCKMLYDDVGRPLDFLYLGVNNAFGRLTGLEDVIGKRVTEVIPGIKELHPELFEIYGRVASTGQSEKFEIELLPLRVWLAVSVYSIEKDHFVAIFDNITERKHAEEELHKLAEDLKRSNADLQQFAYIASHDLQTPLRNVEGFVKMLARRYRGKLDEKADEFIEYISSGVKDMQVLIMDILEYSKVGSGDKTLSVIDTSLCIGKAISNLSEEIEEKKAEIVLTEPFPSVLGDPLQLTSLFQNLIGNAIKFCGGRPLINISVEKKGREYVFSVRDNGIGINSEDCGKIFAVFHRLHSKSDYPGTGIGLAICQKIVERHGGRIWVESEQGKGSTFFFTLPAQE